MLSLARRAGKLISGEDTVSAALKGKKCSLVIIACDASDNTKKRITARAENNGIECIVTSSREELSNAAGLYNRAVFALTDRSFAQNVKAALVDM